MVCVSAGDIACQVSGNVVTTHDQNVQNGSGSILHTACALIHDDLLCTVSWAHAHGSWPGRKAFHFDATLPYWLTLQIAKNKVILSFMLFKKNS